jgi:hypothetical protein
MERRRRDREPRSVGESPGPRGELTAAGVDHLDDGALQRPAGEDPNERAGLERLPGEEGVLSFEEGFPKATVVFLVCPGLLALLKKPEGGPVAGAH